MGIKHEWNGTILTITSDSGTSSCDLKGEKGDDGARGARGAVGLCEVGAKLNLLDNSYFKKPINQRGKASYTETKYTIDRWYLEGANAALSVNANGISVSGTLTQRMPKGTLEAGKPYTFIVYLTNGNKVVFTNNASNDYVGMDGYTNNINLAIATTPTEYDRAIIIVEAGATVEIEAAALYEGSYTIGALPNYCYKGYAAELVECQRYYWQTTNTYYRPWNAFMNGGIQMRMLFPLPVQMRIKPTITYPNDCIIHPGSATITAVADIALDNNYVMLIFTISGGTANTPCALCSSGTFTFSADL